ncbi:MAG TPA: Zn-ribbon domain-containing OB-fold protein [Mycobacteriales bacterium]|nr:Zn-ribbon domain-containing OB-fold protein [Mycobacteriales bacterium]
MSEPEVLATPGPVTVVETPIALHYSYTPGVASARFLRSLERGVITGQRCPSCGKVITPPRGACSMCGVATEEEVTLTGNGTITTFCTTQIPSPGLVPPYVTAWIRLDGADMTSMFLIQECDPADVRLGMRVEPVWVADSERQADLGNIRYYRPNGEPDAAYEDYKDYV